MIYISHKLGEVFEMSDRITVLRDGRTVGTNDAKDLTVERVIALMVGREVGDVFPTSQHEFGETALEIKNLTAFEAETNKKLVDDVSFSVRRGEVLGISGLMGAGRSELLMAIFGAHLGKLSGEVFVEGRKVNINSPSEAIASGIGFVTEDRKRFGLILDQTILDNMTLAGLKRISGAVLTHRARERGGAKINAEFARQSQFAAHRRRNFVGRQPAKSRAGQMAFNPAESFISR